MMNDEASHHHGKRHANGAQRYVLLTHGENVVRSGQNANPTTEQKGHSQNLGVI
jgi:hypothetical protein